MRFKIDENLPEEISHLLRSLGHEAETAIEESLGGSSDEVVAATCRLERRILLTLDVGLGDIRAYPPAAHAGIVVLRASSQDKHSLLRLAERLAGLLGGQDPQGQLWIVDETRVRIRW